MPAATRSSRRTSRTWTPRCTGTTSARCSPTSSANAKTGDYIINVVEARLGAVRNGIRFRGLQIDPDAKEVTVDGEAVDLSIHEYNLLKLFLENVGDTFTAEDLHKQCWSENTATNVRDGSSRPDRRG